MKKYYHRSQVFESETQSRYVDVCGPDSGTRVSRQKSLDINTRDRVHVAGCRVRWPESEGECRPWRLFISSPRVYSGATVETVELHKWSLHHMPARRGQLVTTGFHVLCCATNTFRGSPFLFNRRYVIIVNLHKKSLYLSCDMCNLVTYANREYVCFHFPFSKLSNLSNTKQ